MAITPRKVQKWIRILMIAGFFVFLGITLFKFTQAVRACEGDSLAASYARSLSQERLARLHADMKSLRQTGEPLTGGPPYEVSSKDHPLPPAFQDIRCILIRPNGNTPVIRLEGCLDNFLDLRFYGIGESQPGHPGKPERQARIVLEWGEHENHEEVLWFGPPAP